MDYGKNSVCDRCCYFHLFNTSYYNQCEHSSNSVSNTWPVLQSPLYVEDDKTSSQKTLFVNGTTHARAVTFLGHGMAKGVNYTDIGRALIILRGSNGVIESKGQGAMITSGGKASFTFHEIGHSDSNGTIAATGAAFFDTNATGKLAILCNVVAV